MAWRSVLAGCLRIELFALVVQLLLRLILTVLHMLLLEHLNLLGRRRVCRATECHANLDFARGKRLGPVDTLGERRRR